MSQEPLKPEERIILALDFAEFEEAEGWVKRFKGKIHTYKVGPILYLKHGKEILSRFSELRADLFLDLKFHDIPSTVEKTVRQLAGLNIKMFTLHALGGFDMMKRVSDSVAEQADKLSKPKPLTLAVTVLTSHDESTLNEIGINNSTKDEVLKLAGVAEKAGIDGDQGDAQAQFYLGNMYSEGRGVPQDDAYAVRWYRLVANQGIATAQYNLGVAYNTGRGVPQDYVEAHMWYNLAATQLSGEKRDGSVEARDAVAERMTAEQIAEAQRRAREWTPTREP